MTMTAYNDSVLVALASRVPLYALLQRAFGVHPDERLLDVIADDRVQVCIDVLFGETDEADVRAGFSAMKERIAEQRESDLDALLRSCERDYTHLFIGPEKLVAPPWESVYRTNERELFSKHTLAVRQAYKQQGFLPGGYPREADDHLAFELDFMRALAESSLERCQGGEDVGPLLQAQRAFIDEHLGRWAKRWARDVGAADLGALYPSLADLMVALVEADSDLLLFLEEEIAPKDKQKAL